MLLSRKSICWTKCLQLGGKLIIHRKLLESTLFIKDKHSYVFECAMFLFDSHDDNAGKFMLGMCGESLVLLCLFIMHPCTYFIHCEIHNMDMGQNLEALF